MKPTWIIENFVKESSYIELAQAVEKADYPLILIKDFNSKQIEYLNGQCVIFNGSIQMVELIKCTLNKAYPVAYCHFEKYLCQAYYPYFVNYLFNDHCAWTTLEQFYYKKWFYYGIFGKEAMLFIRPNSGDKPFTARLLDIQDIEKFYKENEHLKYEMVVISTPKNILGEWRVVVSKKGIISVSCYKYQNLITKVPGAPSNVIALAEELLNKINYYPDSVFCYDICQDNDSKPYLLELTSFSSAGLYATNKDKIVKEVSEIVIEDFNNHVL